MANMMQFDLVSPERRLASLKANSVQIPATDGDLTAMPDHAPMITTLRPGILTVEGPDGTVKYAVTGGFAEISGPATTILAERAHPIGEVTTEIMDEIVAEAETRHTAAQASDVENAADATAKLLSDMVAMRGHIRLDTNQPNL